MSALPPLVGYLGCGALVAYRFGLPRLRAARRIARVRAVCRAQGGPLPRLETRLVALPCGPEWAERQGERIEALGFVRLGAFTEEGASVQAVVLLHPEGFVAQATVGGSPARTVSLYAHLEGGDVATATDAPALKIPVARPPWSRYRHLPRAGPAALLAALRGEVGAARVLAVTPETYVAVEADYGRRVAEWILVHGPLRPEMIPRLEAMTGMKADPAALALLKSAHAAKGVYPHS